MSSSSSWWENDLPETKVRSLVKESLVTSGNTTPRDGELFLERSTQDVLVFKDNLLKESSYHTNQGFGLRSVCEEFTSYAHSADVSLPALKAAHSSLREGRTQEIPPTVQASPIFSDTQNDLIFFEERLKLLNHLNQFTRSLDSSVQQVSMRYSASTQDISILRADTPHKSELRIFVHFGAHVIVEKEGRREEGSVRFGGRIESLERIRDYAFWEEKMREALRRALLQLSSIPAPSGSMPVVLGAGIPGILLHEAVGHGFEGDFNRKDHSVFSTKMGKDVASSCVTVIDEGSLDIKLSNNHGSFAMDDEGTPTQKTTLIENGKMVGHMHDRLNARLMKEKPTGNGRRQSYKHAPMPRMTNTYMEAGETSLEVMLGDMKKGVYAVGFSSGQVDIVSGNFVFAMSEAYLVENGQIGAPLKGATLIGNGPQTMKKIESVGSDLCLDSGFGLCGKEGQTVIVGVGQPSCLISSLTVGGTGQSAVESL